MNSEGSLRSGFIMLRLVNLTTHYKSGAGGVRPSLFIFNHSLFIVL